MFQKFHRGPGDGPLPNEQFNALLRDLESLVTSAGPGLYMRSGPSGRTFMTRKPRAGSGGDRRFLLSFRANVQKIHVSTGNVVGAATSPIDTAGGRILDPQIPIIDGVPLPDSDGISVEDLPTGKKIGVYVIAGDGPARIEAHEAKDWQPEEDETAFVIGYFKLIPSGDGKILDGEIDQRWLSDVPIGDEAILAASDSRWDSGFSDELGSSDSDLDPDDSTPSNSSDDSDLPVPGECGVKATARWVLPSCGYYREDPFSKQATLEGQIRIYTLITGNNACRCPGWHARVSIEGAKPSGSTQGLRVDGDAVIFPVPCGRFDRTLNFLFEPAVPNSVHMVIIELMSFPEIPPSGLHPDWKPSKCCNRKMRPPLPVSVKLPPRCYETTLL